jgi:general secretion pathway protein D
MNWLNKNMKSLILLFLFIINSNFLLNSQEAKNPSVKLSGRELVSMDFNNIELKDLVKTISELTGKNFLLDEKVRGKVTIICPTKVTVEEAYRIFLSVLASQELTIVQSGKIYRIIPQRDARQDVIPTIVTAERPPSGDIFITRLIRMKYIDAQEVSELLKNLISKYGNIQTYLPTNTLIITDTSTNISRLMKIIDELDVDIYRETIEVIPLKNANATTVANILTSLYQSTGGALKRTRTVPAGQPAGQPQTVISKIIPDERTNSLIIVANRTELSDLKELIDKLDIQLPGAGQIHVYYLKNAKAEDIAQTLSSLTSGLTPTKSQPSIPIPQQQTGARPSVPVAQFEGGIKIAADPNINALVIISSYQDYLTLRDIIDKLDIPRRQVFVEAAIIEVSLTKLKELGISLHGGELMKGGSVGIEGMQMGPLSTFVLDPTAIATLSGLFGGVFGEPIEVTTPTGTTVQVPSFGAFIRALQTNTDINVLSTPHLLTTDNEEAQITVGQNIPLPTGQVTGVGGTVQTTVSRSDVGITLKVTPQINESDTINLKIHTEISDVAQGPPGVDVNVLGITTSKRSADTTVVVKDRQTVVIGGLVRDDVKETQSKVPILGDIPLLGMLFRSTTKRAEKIDLIIFLTPHIVKTGADLEDVTSRKQKEWEKFEDENLGYESKSGKWIKETLKESKEEREKIKEKGTEEKEQKTESEIKTEEKRESPALQEKIVTPEDEKVKEKPLETKSVEKIEEKKLPEQEKVPPEQNLSPEKEVAPPQRVEDKEQKTESGVTTPSAPPEETDLKTEENLEIIDIPEQGN